MENQAADPYIASNGLELRVSPPPRLGLVGAFQAGRRTLELEDRGHRRRQHQFRSCFETPIHPHDRRTTVRPAPIGMKGAKGLAVLDELVAHRRRPGLAKEPQEE